jgi:hypothetical protein
MAYCSAVAAVVTTTNITITAPGTSTFDGITLSSGARVLLTAQTSQSQNGVWIFNGSGSAMTRPAITGDPFVSGSQLDYGIAVPVTGGSAGGLTWGGSEWWLDSPTSGTATVDTSNLTFIRRNATPVQARVASTSSVTISSPGATIDGVTVNVGDVVLLVGQSTNIANGLYTFQGSSAAMTRTADPIYPNIEVLVSEGSTQLHTRWKLVTQAAGNVVLGTTALTFSAQNLFYNVLDFGADPTGTNASDTFIQAAIDTCQSAGGGTVAIPNGTYLIAAPLVISYNGNKPIQLVGTSTFYGSGSTLTASVAMAYMLSVTGSNKVYGLYFNGNNNAQYGLARNSDSLSSYDSLGFANFIKDGIHAFSANNLAISTLVHMTGTGPAASGFSILGNPIPGYALSYTIAVTVGGSPGGTLQATLSATGAGSSLSYSVPTSGTIQFAFNSGAGVTSNLVITFPGGAYTTADTYTFTTTLSHNVNDQAIFRNCSGSSCGTIFGTTACLNTANLGNSTFRQKTTVPGTLSTTANSNVITGTSTTFLTTCNPRVGDFIFIGAI